MVRTVSYALDKSASNSMSTKSSKHYITYSPTMSTTHSSGIPCMQRFVNNRWKMIALITVLVVQLVVILAYYLPSKTLTAAAPSGRASSTPLVVEQVIQTTNSTEPPVKESQQRFPHFIVIGVKKCGTRALLNFLKIHPDIKTASHEVHFFDRNETYSKGLEWYRTQMPFSYPDQLTGEKSPSYFRESYVPERIHRFNKTVKLILVVREPIERCMSNYLQHATGYDDFPSFESEVLREDNGEVNTHSPHVYNSDYNLFIDSWLKWFPRPQLKVVDGNLLITDPHLVLEELQEFLGVRQFIGKEFFKFDSQKGFYCYYNHSTTLKCLGDTKGRKHPPISNSTRAKLYKYFEPRNKAFFEKIGKTFKWGVTVPS